MTAFHTLHILNKTPDHPRFSECLGTLGTDDALILTENGVLALATEINLKTSRIYALTPDVEARGMAGTTRNSILVDYPEMVDLTLQAQRVISW